jgi:hypothetical protein
MLDADAIKKIEELVLRGAEVKVVHGLPHTPVPYTRLKNPEPEALEVKTLTAIIDYLRSDADVERAGGTVFIHVIDQATVAIRSTMHPLDAHRETYLMAKCQPNQFTFGRFMDTEEFIIGVQALFVDEKDRSTVLQLMGNIKEENVQNTGDDGVSQKVTAKQGVSLVTTARVPNPVTLAPYRTFPEVDQPTSPFVFRLQSGPKAALIEADGGAWKNKAIASIADFLRSNLKDYTTRPVHIIA